MNATRFSGPRVRHADAMSRRIGIFFSVTPSIGLRLLVTRLKTR
jgi:hypothetical protein